MTQKTNGERPHPNAEQLETLASLEETAKPGAYETLILHERLHTLIKGTASGEMPYKVFLDVCQCGLDTLKDYQDNLAESPAAHVLLAYLQIAFQKYIITTASDSSETADRRFALAKAFGITGKARRLITEAQKIEICSAFSSDLYEVTERNSREPTRKDFTHATRAAYKAHFGRDWGADDAAKKGEKTIRKILKKEGYLGT